MNRHPTHRVMRALPFALAAVVFAQVGDAWAPPENNAARCGDGVDNEPDGLIDCLDPDCNGTGFCEFGTEVSCSDTVDNDYDGVADGADTDCAAPFCGDNICDLDEGPTNCTPDCGSPHVLSGDFATCPYGLSACDAASGVESCCHRNFTAGSIIIPLDRCHQALTNTTIFGPPTAADAFCHDPTSAGASEKGMFEAYGLVYRLMQNDIPVYWVVNPTKDPPALKASQTLGAQSYTDRDIDMWVLKGTGAPPTRGGSVTPCGTSCSDQPVSLLDASLSPIANSYTAKEFPLRGAAFVIDAADRTEFDKFWNAYSTLTVGYEHMNGNAFYDFTDVSLYEINNGAEVQYLDYRGTSPYSAFNGGDSAPVAVTLNYEPPRLARQDPAAVSDLWLADAKLDEEAKYPECLTGNFIPETAIYCNMSETDVQAGYLVQGRFDWAWFDNWSDNSNCTDATEANFMTQVQNFLTGVPGVKDGRSVMMMESSMQSAEQCYGYQLLGNQNAAGPGLEATNTAPTEGFNIRYPANLFTQWGDVPTAFAAGSPAKWTAHDPGDATIGYQALSSLVRLVSEDVVGNTLCSFHKAGSICDSTTPSSTTESVDSLAYATYKDDPANGVVFYMAGRNVMQQANSSHLRALLNSFLAVPSGNNEVDPPLSTLPVEVARSAPVTAAANGIDAVFQGTVDVITTPRPVTRYDGSEDDGTFDFPHFKGHMRAIDIAAFQAGAVDYSNSASFAGDVIFDAASSGKIPTANPAGCASYFDGSCRTVFTNTRGGENASNPPNETQVDAGNFGSRPNRVLLTVGNLGASGPQDIDADNDSTTSDLWEAIGTDLDATEAASFLTFIVNAPLGGVDRSSVAVIEESPQIPVARPTMAYFGGLDGMLHAVCVDVQDYCGAIGQELWAFMPRTQIPLARRNWQRIDGSPTVADVYGDFGDGNEFRTILTFATGSGDPGFEGQTPAVYAIDISDPSDPQILWELVTQDSNQTRSDGEEAWSAIDMGVAQQLAMGPLMVGGDQFTYTYIQSNNGGTNGLTMTVVKAVDTATGEVAWTWSDDLDQPPLANKTRNPVTAWSAGVALADSDGNDLIDYVLVATLRGDLWRINADDGTNDFTANRDITGDGTPEIAGAPLFSFEQWRGVDGNPIGASPSVFSEKGTGKLVAFVASGGYADLVGISEFITPSTTEQFGVGVYIDATAGYQSPVFDINLGAGNRAFAQSTIAGNEIYIVTDTTDVNSSSYGLGGNTGRLLRYNLSTVGGGSYGVGDAQQTIVMRGGAGSVDAGGGEVIGEGNASGSTLANFDADAEGVEALLSDAQSERHLWLRLR